MAGVWGGEETESPLPRLPGMAGGPQGEGLTLLIGGSGSTEAVVNLCGTQPLWAAVTPAHTHCNDAADSVRVLGRNQPRYSRLEDHLHLRILLVYSPDNIATTSGVKGDYRHPRNNLAETR